jgi:cytochrome c-type biogenesis protein CcmF
MLPLLVLLAVGPFMPWKQARLSEVMRRLRWAAVGALVFAAAVALTWHTSVGVTLGLGLAAWVLAGTAAQVLRVGQHGGLWPALQRQPRSWWGMVLAHAGLGVFVVGVSLVNGTGLSEDLSLRVGQSGQVGDYRFSFDALEAGRGPNFSAARATFSVTRNGQRVTTLYPEKRFYTVQQMPMTEAAIDRGPTRDLYVSLSERTDDGAWIVRLQLKPFMSWVWGGALLIGLGGLLAASDRRYRLRATARHAASLPPVAAVATPS